jgi:hypothetical protein
MLNEKVLNFEAKLKQGESELIEKLKDCSGLI